MRELSTIGYEGATIDSFVEALKSASVETLLDIREVPISRKAGFSKTKLSSALEKVSIGYVHLRPLGDPKAGREAARSGKYKKFERIFRKHIETEPAQEALKKAIEIASCSHVCLLCYERDHSLCHRNIVAAKMLEIRDFELVHLVPKVERKLRRTYIEPATSSLAIG